MDTSKVSGLADTSALRLFMDFPVPLALLHADGQVELTNGRFDELLDRSCLESEALRDIAAHPGRAWGPARLSRRDGDAVTAQVQAMRISQRTLLAIDTTPGEVQSGELEQLRKRILELEQAGSRDHLTGAWNRAHLDRTIETELARSLRYEQPLPHILIDVDHFKRINDKYGHQVGDAVLRDLVQIITANVRAADVLFRWGGEEFVVLVNASGYRAAERLASHLRAHVEKHLFAAVGTVTVSLGVAEHSGSEGAEEWFRRLDAALYAAKREGRNRVVVDRRGNSDEWAGEHRFATLRLVWQEGYESGRPLIDSQHRRLFDLANALINAVIDRVAAPAAVDTALDQLLRHTALHFADEEALLGAHGYKHLHAHCAAHAKLPADAIAFRARAGRGEMKLGELVEFLADDLIAHHLLSADRDFFPLFSQNRL